MKAAGEGLHGFVDTVLSRRAQPNGTDDVVGRLLARESEDRQAGLFANIVLLLIAGHSSAGLIGNSAAMLLGLSDVRAEAARTRPAGLRRSRLMRLVTQTSSSGTWRWRTSPQDCFIRAGDAALRVSAASPGPRKRSRSRIIRLRSLKPTNRRTWSRHPLLPWRAVGGLEGRVALPE